MPSRAMILRVSPRGDIRYLNAPFARYLGVSAEEYTRRPIGDLKPLCCAAMVECMDLRTATVAGERLLSDDSGRVFEPRVSLDSGLLDLVFNEVTPGSLDHDSFQQITGVPLEDTDEREMGTFRGAALAGVTVAAVRLKAPDTLARNMSPVEAAIVLDMIEEAVSGAVLEFGGTVSSAGAGAFLGIFGAPRQFVDHALRGLLAALQMRERFSDLASEFAEDGKLFPRLGIGIWSGEALAGILGGSRLGGYSAVGGPVVAAQELAALAGENGVLLGEPAASELLANPPEGWEFRSLQTGRGPDLSDFEWGGATVIPLPGELDRFRWRLVPSDAPEETPYFELEYLWQLHPAGAAEPSPVLLARGGGNTEKSIPLAGQAAETRTQNLGRYKLIEVLGVGGMGKVWLGKDRFGCPVAVKVINGHGAPDREAIKRFRREGEVMARLRHRNICRIYEMNEVDGISFIAMEYIGGISLADLLEHCGPPEAKSDFPGLIRSAKEKLLASDRAPAREEGACSPHLVPLEHALSVAIKICEAIEFAHGMGVLHRDLKPANILLREDGEPLVADFGLAKVVGEEGPSLSVTGGVVGTVLNMSPEQADSSKHVDERSDIYSIGTILYRMFSGRHHFAASGNIIVDIPKLRGHEPARLRGANPRIDADLETIVLKCLRPEPYQRYRSASALLDDLRHYLRGEPISARPVSAAQLAWKQIARHKAAAISALAVAALLFGGTIFAFWQISERATEAEAQRKRAEDALAQAETRRGEAEAARAEAEAQRQAALANQKLAEEKQSLAEQKGKEASDSARAASEAQLAQKQAEEETGKMIALRQEAEEEARKMKDQAQAVFLGARENPSGGEARDLPPTMTVRQMLAPDITGSDPEVFLKAIRDAAVVAKGFKGNFPAALDIEMKPGGYSVKGGLPGTFKATLYRLESLLLVYLMGSPKEGWPLYFLFLCATFDLDGLRDAADAMDRLGIDHPPLPPADAGLADMRLLFVGPSARSIPMCGDFQAIQDALMSGVKISGSRYPGAKEFSGFIRMNPWGKRSPAYLALAVSNWNLGAVVEIGFRTEDFGQRGYRVRGSGVVALEPILSDMGEIGTLDISYSSVEEFPTNKPVSRLVARHSALSRFAGEGDFMKQVEELDLSDSRISSVEQICAMPHLKKLDVSRTPIGDVRLLWSDDKMAFWRTSPTRAIKNLEELDISGLHISTFEGIWRFSNLRTLRFSPELLADKDSAAKLKSLKFSSISTPDDPRDQSAATFWRRWEMGAYRKTAKTSPGSAPERSPSGSESPQKPQEIGTSGPASIGGTTPFLYDRNVNTNEPHR